MRVRPLLLAAGLVAGALVASQAEADPGRATGSVNMRQCASTSCARILTIPAGAVVDVLARQGSWYQVQYRGVVGFASGSYISVGGYYVAPPPPPPVYYPQPYYYEYDPFPYRHDYRRPRYYNDHHRGDYGSGSHQHEGSYNPPHNSGGSQHGDSGSQQGGGGVRPYVPGQGHGNEPGGLCAPGDIQCNR